jgi:hypothetical protein
MESQWQTNETHKYALIMCQKIKKALQLIYDRGRRRLHHNQSQNLTHTFLGDLMDKKMEVAAGKKKKGEGDLSSAGGKCTPIARGALARTTLARTGAHQLAVVSAITLE